MDAAPSLAKSREWSEISVVASRTQGQPAKPLQAVDLLRQVDEIVQKHHRDLAICLEDWCAQAVQARHFGTAWSDDPDLQPTEQPAQNCASEHFASFGVVCTEGANSEQEKLAPRRSWKGLVDAPAGPDRMASQVAVRGKTKRKNKTKRKEMLRSVTQLPTMSLLQRITSSRRYEVASGTLILLNAIFIGVQTQFMAERAEAAVTSNRPVELQTPSEFMALQVVFCVLFSIELGLRWVCDGLFEFFRDIDMWWNMLDVGVVLLSIIDLVTSSIIENSSANEVLGNISVLRVIRVVRVVRIARVIRIMKFFRELRMMIFSILGSMKSLLWVILVLVMTFYLFGVTFTAATTSYLASAGESVRPSETESLRRNFGLLDRSILSLFMAMSGGNDWGMYYEALESLPMVYRGLFLLFISFCIFAVVNIVTGVFVESAMQSNQQDREIIVHEELESKKSYLTSMKDLFEEMDEDDTGCITMEEFEKKLSDDRVIAYFNALKLDVSDAKTIFRLLDYDQSKEVDIDEFLSGCYRLQGESRSLDMKIMQCEVRFLQESFLIFHQTLREIKDSLAESSGRPTKRSVHSA